MIREFFLNLVKRAKEVAKVLKEQFNVLQKKLTPAVPVMKFLICGISPETDNAMKAGKR
jgi:hypothetical protein